MKKLISILVMLALMCTMTVSFAAEDSAIKVLVDGEFIEFDVNPMAENGRTLVPMRYIFEALGAEVQWVAEDNKVIATKGNTSIILILGSNVMLKNGEEIVLEVPAKAIDGRTLVPVRAISEALDADVEWDGDTNTVKITTKEEIKHVAMTYGDPEFKMIVLIDNPEWVYYKDKEVGQVYFFNPNQAETNNLVSMSARTISGDIKEEAEKIWDFMKNNLISGGLEPYTNFKEPVTITVADKYIGYIYSYDIEFEGQTLLCDAVFWEAGDMMYICTASSDVENEQEVQKVFNGILSYFMPMQ